MAIPFIEHLQTPQQRHVAHEECFLKLSIKSGRAILGVAVLGQQSQPLLEKAQPASLSLPGGIAVLQLVSQPLPMFVCSQRVLKYPSCQYNQGRIAVSHGFPASVPSSQQEQHSMKTKFCLCHGQDISSGKMTKEWSFSVEEPGIQHLKQSSFKGNACFAPSFSSSIWEQMDRRASRLFNASRNSEGTPGMSALSGQKGPRRVTLNAEAKGLWGHPKPQQPWEIHDMGHAGDSWLLISAQRRSGFSFFLCPRGLRAHVLPPRRALWPMSRTALGEDALCPSCPSPATQQKGIPGARGRARVSWGTQELVRAGWWEGLSVLLLYLCEIKSPHALCRAILLLPTCLELYQFGMGKVWLLITVPSPEMLPPGAFIL